MRHCFFLAVPCCCAAHASHAGATLLLAASARRPWRFRRNVADVPSTTECGRYGPKVTIWVHYQSQARHSSATAKPRPSHIRIGQSTSILFVAPSSPCPPTPASKPSRLMTRCAASGVTARARPSIPAIEWNVPCTALTPSLQSIARTSPSTPTPVTVAFTNQPATCPRTTIIKGDPAPSRVKPMQPPSDLSHLITRSTLSDVLPGRNVHQLQFLRIHSNPRVLLQALISSSFLHYAGPFAGAVPAARFDLQR